MVGRFQQDALFETDVMGRPLPVVGEQKDIRYFGTVARNVLNGPEVTGMGFWSVNPYVGCAFGCAYCYARYTHRWVLDRHATENPEHEDLESGREPQRQPLAKSFAALLGQIPRPAEWRHD